MRNSINRRSRRSTRTSARIDAGGSTDRSRPKSLKEPYREVPLLRRIGLRRSKAVSELTGSANMEAHSIEQRVVRSEAGAETDMYCDNPACDLNVPMKQVVTAPQIKRMDWRAKNGSVRHFCQTCAGAIAMWQADRRGHPAQCLSTRP